MKETIRKVLKEQSGIKEIRFDDGSVLPRMTRTRRISGLTIQKYQNRGYNPYYEEGGELKELPRVARERWNDWGTIYFFNEKEIGKLFEIQEKLSITF